MILQDFPNLQWLKKEIEQRFQSRKGWGGLTLETEGFPNVIINATTKESYRPDVLGPISLFMNIKGVSNCKVDSQTITIPEEYFFISNRYQSYTLQIESKEPVETFNIHIGENFSEGVLGALITPADVILNHGLQQQVATIAFHNKLYRKDVLLMGLIKELYQLKQEQPFNKLLFEELMVKLLHYLLMQHKHIIKSIESMPALKESTRIELYKRLSLALDYIHSHPLGDIDLDILAATACLSKYHFLRLFKQTYKQSPYQYIQQLKLEKAKELLLHTSLPIYDIAETLGFENSNSFSRLFFQRLKVYPTALRAS